MHITFELAEYQVVGTWDELQPELERLVKQGSTRVEVEKYSDTEYRLTVRLERPKPVSFSGTHLDPVHFILRPPRKPTEEIS